MDRETNAIGFVKTALIASGATVTETLQDGMPAWTSWAVWSVTIVYGILQVMKAAPWLSMQTLAFYRGIVRHDWSAWWKIAKREDSSNDDHP